MLLLHEILQLLPFFVGSLDDGRFVGDDDVGDSVVVDGDNGGEDNSCRDDTYFSVMIQKFSLLFSKYSVW